MADGGSPFFWAIIGMGAGIVVFVIGLRSFLLKRMIENIPTSKVRSIAMGLVEVYGSAVPIKAMKSPFSRKDCVYYKYKIEEQRSDGKRTYWATLRKEEKSVPFLLKDDTGSVMVDCAGANMEISVDSIFESGIGHDPPKQVLDFLNAQRIAHDSFLGFNKHMKYTEWFISPGDKLYVLGTAAENRGKATGALHTERVIIRKGENEKLFYVSDKSEKDILKSLGWKSALGVFGGAALIVGGLAFIVFSLQMGLF